MSIIAAKILRDGKKVLLASDNIKLVGNTKSKGNKLYEIIKDKFYVGCTGVSTDGEFICNYLINYFKDKNVNSINNGCTYITDIPNDLFGDGDKSYLFDIFIKAIKHTTNKMCVVNGKERIIDLNTLVYYNHKLYNVFTINDQETKEISMEVLESDRDFLSVGIGSEYATCAMHFGKSPSEAILIANEFSYYINDILTEIEFNYE